MTTSCTQTGFKGPSCSLGNPLTALLLPGTASRLWNMCTREMHFRAPDAEVGVVSGLENRFLSDLSFSSKAGNVLRRFLWISSSTDWTSPSVLPGDPG